MTAREETLSKIVDDQVIELLRSMIKIKCEPEQKLYEAQLAEFLRRKMEDLGFETQLFEKEKGRPSVVGRLHGETKGSAVVFNGHLAAFRVNPWTVDPYAGLIKDGKLYGVGADDMMGAIAAMVCAVSALKRSRVELNKDVVLVFGAGAEGGGLIGTKYAIEQGIRADMAVVGEPTHLDIGICERGTTWVEITTKGIPGLTVKPGTVNAIYKMIDVIVELQKLDKKAQSIEHPILGKPKLSVNHIDLGELKQAPYLVPGKCRIILDRRTVPGEKTESVIAEIQAMIKGVMKEDKEQSIEMNVLSRFEPAEISPKERVVAIAQNAIRGVTGKSPKLVGIPGFTEAMHFIENRIPAIICGPGGLECAHTPDEYVPVSELTNAARIYALIALEAAAK